MSTETRNQAEKVFAAAGGAGPHQFDGDGPGDQPGFALELNGDGITDKPTAPKPLELRPLHVIAADITQHWHKVNYAAVPYLDALHDLNSINDMYGCDSGRSIVRYFLGNATTWRGEDARRVKAELKAMLKATT